MRGVLAVAAALALWLPAPVRADEAGLARAKEVLRQMRELRAARADGAITPEVLRKFGHHVKPQPPLPPPVEDPKQDPCAGGPALKPTGTIRMGGQLRVLVGTESLAIGDDVGGGWKVAGITPKQLTLRNAACARPLTIKIP